METSKRLTLQELEVRYGISRSTLTIRMNKLGLVTIQEKKGHPGYLEGESIAKLDDLHGYIKAHGTQEGYPFPEIEEKSTGSDIDEVSQSALVVEQQEEIVVHPPSNVTQVIQPNIPGAAGYSVINGQRVFEQGLVMATEQIMSSAIAQQYATNPHLLPPEYQTMIGELQNNLKQGMPQPNHVSPQAIAQIVLSQTGTAH